MNKATVILALLVGCAGGTRPPATPGGSAADYAAQDKADLEFLRAFIETQRFSLGKPVSPRLLDDGSQVVFLRAAGPRKGDLGLYAFDVATGQTRELLTPDQILAGAEEQLSAEEKARRERMRSNRVQGFATYQISADQRHILVTLSGTLYVAALDAKGAVQVAGPDSEDQAPFDARFSPDGKWVSFVRGGELWIAPAAGGTARQLTRGAGGFIQHAQAEFVAQEEMDRFEGYWWSPDSKQLAYQVSDNEKVEALFLQDPVDPFVAPDVRGYPRPGTPNVDVRLAVVSLGGGRPTFVEWDRAQYPYLSRVVWAKGGPLTLEVLSRPQQDLALLAADPKTGKTRELVHEHDDTWVNFGGAFAWLEDGSGFLWASEASGWWQLGLHAPDGKRLRELTDGALGFRSIAKVDLAGGQVFVEAGAEPVDGGTYRVPLAGGKAELLTPGDSDAKLVFARKSAARLLNRSNENHSYPIEVFRPDGMSAGVLPDVSEKPRSSPQVTIRKVGGGRGFWTSTVRPSHFDPARKYPVLVRVYGGPGVKGVKRRHLGYVTDQFFADHGYIVVEIDNRGTPGRGRDWERAIFHKFAEVPLADQVTALQALGKLEPAMDLGRVGIAGASFGGYMAALAVMRRPDVFKAGLDVSGVTDWRDSDTCYTERYLGIPEPGKEDPVYTQNGLLPYAPKLERPLLIVHGTADDNVLFVHALRLADALFLAGRPFGFLPLAGATHAPREPERLLRYYQRQFEFFRESL